MNRFKVLLAGGLVAAALAFSACGGANNSHGNTPPASNAPANQPANKMPDAAPFELAKERDALVGKAWAYLKTMYNGKDKTLDEKKVGVPGGWGPGAGKDYVPNIPYTAMVLHGIFGTSAWDPANDMIKQSMDLLIDNQEATGGWSYAPASILPQAKGQRAVYITGIVAELFAEVNKADGPWKGKLDSHIARARDYLMQAQVGNKEGPAPDYDKNKTGYGGWAYSKEEIGEAVGKQGKPASNMSTSIYAIDALHACGVKESDPMWEAALTFLKRNQNAGEVQSEGFKAMYKDKPVKPAEKGSPNYGGSVYSEETSKAGATTNADGTVTLTSYGTMTYNLLRGYLFSGLKKDSLPVTLAWGWIQRNYTVERVPGYADTKEFEQGLYYYYLSMAKTLDVMDVDAVEDAERGTKFNWREDLVKALKSRQKADGSWVNSNETWQENSPTLCTCYVLSALRHTK